MASTEFYCVDCDWVLIANTFKPRACPKCGGKINVLFDEKFDNPPDSDEEPGE